MAEMRKGLGGMGKMGSEMKGKPETKKPAPAATTEGMSGHGDTGEEHTSTITHHADGTHTSEMHGGEPMDHPDHKHLMAHIGHHLTGGDAHKVVHHDGMEPHAHMVDEAGQHQDMEGDPPMDGQDTGGQEEQPMEEHAPMYGGM